MYRGGLFRSLNNFSSSRSKGVMDKAKRAKRVIICGAAIVNIAVVLAIINREKPFDILTDSIVFLVMNGMFAAFFWFANTHVGSTDLKDIAENRNRQDPPR